MCYSKAISDAVKQLILGYIDLYRTHHKGKEKHAHILVAWHKLFSRFAVEGSDPEDAMWNALVSSRDVFFFFKKMLKVDLQS